MKISVSLILLSMLMISPSTTLARQLGMYADSTSTQTKFEAYDQAQTVCTQVALTKYSWIDIETGPGIYDAGVLADITELANYCITHGMSLILNIAPVDGGQIRTPDDLAGLQLYDPLVITRFTSLIDVILVAMGDVEIKALNIGNEHDGWIGDNLIRLAEYRLFFEQAHAIADSVSAYRRPAAPNLPVGTTLTFERLVDPATASQWQLLNADADLIAVTYYPVNESFDVLPPIVVHQHFNQLVAEYADPSKPIMFTELGYPSSPYLSSSDALQADFIHEMFSAWDDHADRIELVTYFKLSDWSYDLVWWMSVYYGFPGAENLMEFLRTLGLRTYAGWDKAGFRALACEAADRGFCITGCDLVTAVGKEMLAKSVVVAPNPFNPRTVISFEMPKAGIARLEIYDSAGGMVCSMSQFLLSGQAKFQWEGRDERGRSMPAGVYFARLSGAGVAETMKLLLVR